jgi:hypothetical protein
MKIGKSLAFTTIDITSGTRLLAQGRHTKFIAKTRAIQAGLEASERVSTGGVTTEDSFN